MLVPLFAVTFLLSLLFILCYLMIIYLQEELLEAYRGIIFNDIEPKIPKLFNYLPKSKLV